MTRDQILKAESWRVKKLPERYGFGEVFIRDLSGADEVRIQTIAEDGKRAEPHVMAELIIASVCDETGNLLLTSADADSLLAKPLRILRALAAEISQHHKTC